MGMLRYNLQASKGTYLSLDETRSMRLE